MTQGLTVDRIEVGQTYQKRLTVTEAMINDFARATGDTNSVHLDEEYAKQTFFGRRVAHGMLTGGIIGGVFGTEFPGIGTIYLSQEMKFLKPVFIDDELIIDLAVEAVDLRRNRVTMSTEVTNHRSEAVLTGRAVVMPPR